MVNEHNLMAFRELTGERASITQDASLDEGDQWLMLDQTLSAKKSDSFFDEGLAEWWDDHVLSLLTCSITLKPKGSHLSTKVPIQFMVRGYIVGPSDQVY